MATDPRLRRHNRAKCYKGCRGGWWGQTTATGREPAIVSASSCIKTTGARSYEMTHEARYPMLSINPTGKALPCLNHVAAQASCRSRGARSQWRRARCVTGRCRQMRSSR